MEKYLVLEFRNAGLFRKHRNTKDKMFDMGIRSERKDALEHIEPITSQQISNMLHVLFGKRPKPMNRETVYSADEYLIDKAKNSFLKITSYKNDKNQFFAESIQLKKSVHNAWNPVSYMNWNRVERLLGEELFNEFMLVIKKVFSLNREETTFNKVKELILNTKDERLDNIFIELNKNGKKALYDSIFGVNNQLSSINMNARTQLTVTSGLDKIIRLDGQILVPVDNNDIEILRNNKGCATILDGGLVLIKSVKSANSLDTNGFTLVGDISLEKQ
jgi:hypothetical protein